MALCPAHTTLRTINSPLSTPGHLLPSWHIANSRYFPTDITSTNDKEAGEDEATPVCSPRVSCHQSGISLSRGGGEVVGNVDAVPTSSVQGHSRKLILPAMRTANEPLVLQARLAAQDSVVLSHSIPPKRRRRLRCRAIPRVPWHAELTAVFRDSHITDWQSLVAGPAARVSRSGISGGDRGRQLNASHPSHLDSPPFLDFDSSSSTSEDGDDQENSLSAATRTLAMPHSESAIADRFDCLYSRVQCAYDDQLRRQVIFRKKRSITGAEQALTHAPNPSTPEVLPSYKVKMREKILSTMIPNARSLAVMASSVPYTIAVPGDGPGAGALATPCPRSARRTTSDLDLAAQRALLDLSLPPTSSIDFKTDQTSSSGLHRGRRREVQALASAACSFSSGHLAGQKALNSFSTVYKEPPDFEPPVSESGWSSSSPSPSTESHSEVDNASASAENLSVSPLKLQVRKRQIGIAPLGCEWSTMVAVPFAPPPTYTMPPRRRRQGSVTDKANRAKQNVFSRSRASSRARTSSSSAAQDLTVDTILLLMPDLSPRPDPDCTSGASTPTPTLRSLRERPETHQNAG